MIEAPPCRDSTPEEVAYHEAGHAVVGHLEGLRLIDVDVLADPQGGNGHTNFQPPPWFDPARLSPPLDERGRRFAESVVVTFLAGSVAEARRAGFRNWQAAGFDLDAVIREWARLLAPPDQSEARLATLNDRAEKRVDDGWQPIDRLARALQQARRLEAEEALAAAGLA